MKSKADRQRETALMVKCDCGNVAGLNRSRCGACEAADDHHENQIVALHGCRSVDDLKEFIADYLMNS